MQNDLNILGHFRLCFWWRWKINFHLKQKSASLFECNSCQPLFVIWQRNHIRGSKVLLIRDRWFRCCNPSGVVQLYWLIGSLIILVCSDTYRIIRPGSDRYIRKWIRLSVRKVENLSAHLFVSNEIYYCIWMVRFHKLNLIILAHPQYFLFLISSIYWDRSTCLQIYHE